MTYSIPRDDESQRALELVMRWPMRAEPKLAWMFLLSRGGGFGADVRVHPAEVAGAQGHDARGGFRHLQTLIEQRLAVLSRRERGVWVLRLRHPAHVLRERVEDGTIESPQLLLPFMEAHGELESLARESKAASANQVMGTMAARSGAVGAELDGSIDDVAMAEVVAGGAHAGAVSADVAQHPQFLEVLKPSNLESKPFPASTSTLTSEVQVKVVATKQIADVAQHPHSSGFRPYLAEKPAEPQAMGHVVRELSERWNGARELDEDQVGFWSATIRARVRDEALRPVVIRRVAIELARQRIGRAEFGEVCDYIDRLEREGRLLSSRWSVFVGTMKHIFAREGLKWTAGKTP